MFEEFEALTEKGDWLVDAQAALLAGDTAAVRRRLDEERIGRRNHVPYSISIDALYPEAELLVALGDPAAAARWLDPTLRALPQADPTLLAYPERAASLVWVAVLKADVAERLGDHEEAERWARAVLILWSSADEFLQPTVSRMRRIAE